NLPRSPDQADISRAKKAPHSAVDGLKPGSSRPRKAALGKRRGTETGIGTPLAGCRPWEFPQSIPTRYGIICRDRLRNLRPLGGHGTERSRNDDTTTEAKAPMGPVETHRGAAARP